MNMPVITIIYSTLLIILGVAGYVITEMVSVTALIPAFFGIVFLICGLLALKESLLKHAMHAAAALALLSFFGVAKAFLKIPALLDGTAERPEATTAQVIMGVLTIIFVALCVKSFIDVRRARKAAEAAE